MSIESLFLSPVYLPLLGAALLMLSRSFFKKETQKYVSYVAVILGLVLPLLFLIRIAGEVYNHQQVQVILGAWQTNLGIHFTFDGLSFLLIMLNLLVSIPVWLYHNSSGQGYENFTTIFLIQSASIAAASLTSDLFNLFVCLEVMGVTSYVLVASSGKNQAILSSFTYLMFSATAMVFFLIGVFGLYRISGSLSYEIIAEAKNNLNGSELISAKLSLVLIVTSVLLRSAVIPLSGWLVGAHSNAPHAVSAMLSGVLIKIPLFALVRLLLLVIDTQQLGATLAWAGGISALGGILLALREYQAKRLLAYSSISQIGYVVAAYGLAIEYGVESITGAVMLSLAMLYAFSHALAKATLFLTVGRATDAIGTKDLRRARGGIRALKNQGESIPLTFISFLIASLSMCSLPPFLGFWGKNTLLYAAKSHNVAILLTITSALTIMAYMKLSYLFFPDKTIQEPIKQVSMPHTPVLPFLMLSTLLLAGGIWFPQAEHFVLTSLAPLGSRTVPIQSYRAYQDIVKTGITVLIAIAGFFLIIKTKASKYIEVKEVKTASFSNLFFGFALSVGILAYQLLR